MQQKLQRAELLRMTAKSNASKPALTIVAVVVPVVALHGRITGQLIAAHLVQKPEDSGTGPHFRPNFQEIRDSGGGIIPSNSVKKLVHKNLQVKNCVCLTTGSKHTANRWISK